MPRIKSHAAKEMRGENGRVQMFGCVTRGSPMYASLSTDSFVHSQSVGNSGPRGGVSLLAVINQRILRSASVERRLGVLTSLLV